MLPVSPPPSCGSPRTASWRAYGYSLVDGEWARTDQSLTSSVLGDGGIYSSIALKIVKAHRP